MSLPQITAHYFTYLRSLTLRTSPAIFNLNSEMRVLTASWWLGRAVSLSLSSVSERPFTEKSNLQKGLITRQNLRRLRVGEMGELELG